MQVNLNKELLSIDNSPILNDDRTSMTAKSVIIQSLLGQTNEKIGGLNKHKCYLTYKKIIEVKEDQKVSLTSEEITAIKALVDKYYGPIIVGQIYELFEE